MKMHYREAIEYLNAFQFHGFRLGLERMEQILAALGHPERECPVIHVAGTNGKGSVCATLSAILDAAGYRVGLYTSPHLVSVRERFRISEDEITEGELAGIIQDIKGLVERGYELSYFEFSTVIAFLWFRIKEAGIAVIETGLGGRLDATNVVTPLVSVITGIARDHEAFLGSTIREIAREKAGIVKPRVPVVSGAVSGEAKEVIRDACLTSRSELWELGRDFDAVSRGGAVDYEGKRIRLTDLRPRLAGAHQARNLALALASCEHIAERGILVSEEDMRKGCEAVRWPCRCELLERDGKKVLIDGAHNPDGVRALRTFLDTVTGEGALRPGSLLWAVSDEGGGKDILGMLGFISPLFPIVYITEPPGPRQPVTVERWQGLLDRSPIRMEKSWDKALELALDACPPGGCLCVAGSLYLAGRVRERLFKKGFRP